MNLIIHVLRPVSILMTKYFSGDANDYLLAEETMYFAHQLNIFIEDIIFKRYLFLLHRKNKPISQSILIKQKELSDNRKIKKPPERIFPFDSPFKKT